jgi:nucleotide-binding universal stress UspA family protein
MVIRKEAKMEHPSILKPIRILFACDGSEHSLAAASLLQDLPLPPGSTVFLIAVLIPRNAASHSLLENMLHQVSSTLKMGGVRDVQPEIITGYPAEQIIEYAQTNAIDLVVIGAKGLRHTLGIFLGGVAQQVLEYSPAPVLVVRAPYSGLHKILLATDGSTHSQDMLGFVCRQEEQCSFPLPQPAAVNIAHVVNLVEAHYQYLYTTYTGRQLTDPWDEIAILQNEEDSAGKEILAQAVESLKQGGISAEPVMMHGDAATEIISYAKENQVDLIVCGSRGLSPARGWLLGSVSRKLVHYAGCSVLVVK